jgi:hypothetical protein
LTLSPTPSGLDRKAAEAYAEALAKHVLPELATEQDLEVSIERPAF